MKVIDLLNKIANGEIFKNVEIEYFDNNNLYKDRCYLKENEIIYRLYYGNIELNDEIEIIEDTPKIRVEMTEKEYFKYLDEQDKSLCNEEKKIPEKITMRAGMVGSIDNKLENLDINIMVAEDKINEIIDYLQSKGE